MFKKFQALGKAINAIKPTVPTTKKEKKRTGISGMVFLLLGPNFG